MLTALRPALSMRLSLKVLQSKDRHADHIPDMESNNEVSTPILSAEPKKITEKSLTSMTSAQERQEIGKKISAENIAGGFRETSRACIIL